MSGFDDKELLEFAKKLGLKIEKEQQQLSTIDFDKITEVREVFYAILNYFEGKANVSIAIHKPFKSSASISIVGNTIVLDDISIIKNQFSKSDNFHVYSKTDGTIVLDLGFEGMMR